MLKLPDYFAASGQFYFLMIDPEGYLARANPLFTRHFMGQEELNSRPHISSLLIPSDTVQFLTLLKNCLDNPQQLYPIQLILRRTDGVPVSLNWECSAYTNDQGLPLFMQAISTVSPAPGYTARSTELGKGTDERYMALEHSAEGLWMFEGKAPVSIHASPDQILAYWRDQTVLVECNDNMARMYGFETAGEMKGTRLDKLLDFSEPDRVASLRAFIQNGFATTTVETREQDKFGNVKYFLNRMTGVVEQDQLLRVWGTQQDITAQRLAEEKLRESEYFFRNLFVNSLDGIFITDERGIIKFVSPSVTPILGYEDDEALGHNCFDYVHPEDKEQAMRAFETERNEATKVEFISIRVRKKSGDWLWCIVRGHNLLDNTYVKGIVISFYNDTFRKKTENALKESEARFRYQATILNNVTDVIVTTDTARVVTSWNHVIEKLTGITAEEAVGKAYRIVVKTDYAPYTSEQVLEIVEREGIWRGEASFMGMDGERKILLHTISMLYDEKGNKIGLLGVGKDITDRKKAQARLQESELFYRNLIAQSLDGIVLTDDSGTIRYCSPSIHKISGYDTAYLLGRKIFEFVHPADIQSAYDAFAIEMRSASQINYLSLRLRHANEDWVWCTVRGHNLMDNPVFNAMVIYFTNDSKRKAIEDKLRESEQRFRSLVQNVQMGVTMREPSGKLIMANRAAEEMLGLDTNELSCSFAHTEEWDTLQEDGTPINPEEHPVPVSVKTGLPVRGVVMRVYRKKFNDRVWILVNTEPILDADGKVRYVICSFMDITEQKRMAQLLIDQEIQKQKQVTQATIDAQEKERTEIGKELHDNINQHLNTTRLYLEVAKEKASGEVLQMINLAHKNMAGIINEIRQLSQSLVPPTLGDLGLAESIQDLCDGLRRAHKYKIKFTRAHFDEEAIPDNLKLSLFRIIQEKVSNIIRHSGATQISIKLQTDAEFLFLTIMDNGKGFDAQTAREGLGLSNIRTRVALFNGKMELKTAPGEGCTLNVTIPYNREPEAG
jgi:PAS domain S-box-containing protein